jgi:hypothetical protein
VAVSFLLLVEAAGDFHHRAQSNCLIPQDTSFSAPFPLIKEL